MQKIQMLKKTLRNTAFLCHSLQKGS
jgi:hypothetical protein